MPRKVIKSPETLREIFTAMGEVYRLARMKQMDTLDMSRFMSGLTQMRQCIEATETEDRIDAIEQEMRARYD
jgi:hypothetical protein